SDASEGGYTTIQHMADEVFYEEDRVPEVFAIDTAVSMIDVLLELENRLKVDPHSFSTVVVDSLTMYAEMMFSELEVAQQGKPDNRRLYGELGSHLRYLMITIHKMPVNVLWLALAKEGGEDHSLGGISIPGQTATKAPARCDVWCHLEQAGGTKTRAPTYKMHFQNHGGFRAGHRFGDMLPPVIENPSYRKIESALRLEPWTDRYVKKSKSRPKPQARKAAAR
ncbi:hypothetical protein LCGC14_2879110, partial [marine sediment metagenome]